jgi:hypothetical protein
MARPSGEQHDALVGASNGKGRHYEGGGENRQPGKPSQEVGLRLHQQMLPDLELTVRHGPCRWNLTQAADTLTA